jgi:hypothetical protein
MAVCCRNRQQKKQKPNNNQMIDGIDGIRDVEREL